jgi:DNA-directed RNA polymerase specialized sigma24 family protein
MNYEPFVDNLLRILEKNGYPEKRVALPLERLYEAAYEKQLNFNKALEILLSRGVNHEKTAQKIIFFPNEPASSVEADSPKDFAAMMTQAMEMLNKLSPEQRAELEKMVVNMSDEEKAQMMEKAKSMGLKM